MINRGNLIINSLLIILSITLSVYASGPGTNVAEFLRIGIGARPLGMGEAYSAISDDVYGINSNPAGIVNIEKNEVSLTHVKWFAGIGMDNILFAKRIKEKGTMGIGVISLDSGNISETDMDALEEIIETGRDYKITDIALTISYATKLNAKLFGVKMPVSSAGLNMKYYQEQIKDSRSNGVGVDCGFKYDVPKKDISLGLVIQNLGSQLKGFNDKKERLPLNLKLGGAYRRNLKDKIDLTTSLDIEKSHYDETILHIGSELKYDFFALRIGYNSDKLRDSNMSAGFGFEFLDKYGIDYAWVPYTLLGETHRISFMAKF
ncbi:MAG: hypothetical protein COX40_01740 [Candidatus Omnitrophica bacterium CG23_combo_of_CG06-09_8_20_14_all_40_11]|nr:MAG: hypothetical protein COX40_01740 [Candidatus Omnitrophica bacterium CG23_combo_of_CG06-09_8_20_14_all_40_11]